MMEIGAAARRIDVARHVADQLDGAIATVSTLRETSGTGVMNSLFRGRRERAMREGLESAAAQAEEGARLLDAAGIHPGADARRHTGYVGRELRRIAATPDLEDTLDHRLTSGFFQSRRTLVDELRTARAVVRALPVTNPVVTSRSELRTVVRELADQTLAKPNRELDFDDLTFLDQLAEFDNASRLRMDMPGANASVPFDYRYLLDDPRDAERITNRLVSLWHTEPEYSRHVANRTVEDSPSVVRHLDTLRDWVTRSRQIDLMIEGRGEVPTGLSGRDLAFLFARLHRATELLAPLQRAATETRLAAAALRQREIERQLASGHISDIRLATAALDDATSQLSALDGAVAPELEPLLASTRTMIDDNRARLAGTLRDGYGNHPKYEEIGRIRANVALLDAVSKIRATAAASVDDATLTW